MKTNDIYGMLADLQHYNNEESHEAMLFRFIQERLNTSLNTYEHELKMSLDFLERRKALLYLARKVNKIL